MTVLANANAYRLAAVNMVLKGDRAKQVGFKPTGKPVVETMEEDLAGLE